MEIRYAQQQDLSVDEFVDVLKRSTLSERRPIDETERVAGMIQNADVITRQEPRMADWSVFRVRSLIFIIAPTCPILLSTKRTSAVISENA